MSRERELLQRIVDYMWEGELVDEIKELLAQPEQEPKFNFDLERMKAAIESPISDVTVDDLAKQVKQAPVAWCQLVDGKVQDLLTSFEMKDWLYDKSWIPLYTAPPKRERINHDDILDRSIDGSFEYRDGFMDGVMFAENHHGIGVDDEN